MARWGRSDRRGRLPQLTFAAARGILPAFLMAFATGCAEQPLQNLVVISIDTLAADRMSSYGAERETTPAIDRLRERALLFRRAYSTSPRTLTAHASMLTGRYPSRLTTDEQRRYGTEPMLSELFEKAGYRTAAVTAGLYISKAFGFGQGFEVLREADVPAAIEWIEAHRDEPFFLFFHTYLPHAPYWDRRYVEPGEGGRIAGIFGKDDKSLHMEICCEGMKLTLEEREFLLALYDGGISAADEAVGALLEKLSELGLMERTTVVVTSDHGEEFWEHTGGAAQHGHTLYDELLRVPLIWYEPGLETAGATDDTPVSLLDLVPTVIARFGLEAPETLDGVDLSPLLEGEGWRIERPLFGEETMHGPERFSIQTARGKLVVTPSPRQQRGLGRKHPVPVRSRRELYLPGDPGERRNVILEHPELAAELAARLATHRRGAVTEGKHCRDIAGGTAGCAFSDVPSLSPKRQAELEAELRQMGYIE